MADTTIADLTDGTTLNATDRIPVARSPFASGDNRYVTGTEIHTFIDSVDAWLKNVVEDTSPELGGTLDANSFSIKFDDNTGIQSANASVRISVDDTAVTGIDSFTDSILLDVDDGSFPAVLVRSINAAGTGPSILTYHDSSSPEANDQLAAWYGYGRDSANNIEGYGRLSLVLVDATSTLEDAQWLFRNKVAGSNVNQMFIGDGVLIGTSGTMPGSGNLSFADGKGIFDGAGNELVIFQQTSSAANYLEIENSPDWYPIIRGNGSDAQVGIVFEVKGDMGDGLAAYEFYCGTGNAPQIRIWSEGDQDEGPWLNFRNAGEPVAGNICGHISMGGGETGFPDSHQIYSYLVTRVLDPTPGSEDGELTIATPVAGSNLETPRIKIADGVIIGSSSVYPGAGNLRVTGIELGHDTDTTLTRSSAGVLAIEGSPAASANNMIRTVGITIDGGGAEITTGFKGYIEVPYAGTISAWTLLGDTSGAIVIDVWKETYANFPPDNTDSITNGSEPEITASGVKAQDTNLGDWTTVAVAAGDILAFNVDSCTAITRAHLTLKVTVS
jgi:hypothetical protein